MKIVIAGGTGFIGRYLSQRYRALGHDVIIIARSEGISWTDHSKIKEALEHADLLINMAGKSVNCRYNEKNKKAIFDSRLKTTDLLGNIIRQCQHPPRLWINSSTATIYRHAEDRPMTEEQGEIGKGFSVEVAKAWEKIFFSQDTPRTRQIALRMAIVLGRQGGVMEPLKSLTRSGLGGYQGNGRQMFSWIHIDDLFHIIEFLQENKTLYGVFNCSAPHPVTNRNLMAKLRQNMHVKIGLPSPKWLLEIGAVFIRTETELVLKSRWVLPDRLQSAGFRFRYNTLDDALREIIAKQ